MQTTDTGRKPKLIKKKSEIEKWRKIELDIKEFILNNNSFASVKAHKEFRYQLCQDALELCSGNKTKAAEMLGISRTTFKDWVDEN